LKSTVFGSVSVGLEDSFYNKFLPSWWEHIDLFYHKSRLLLDYEWRICKVLAFKSGGESKGENMRVCSKGGRESCWPINTQSKTNN